VVTVNQLRFLEVQRRLGEQIANQHLDALEAVLRRDYRVLSYLLRTGPESQTDGFALEDRILKIDYALMRVCFAVTQRLGLPQARWALIEMSQIVGHFANSMGERLAVAPESVR
jgi:hypothetical protein